MAEITFNSRIIHKHDVEANWLNKTFTPNKGEIIVYDIDANYNYERFKIGDGKTDVSALPFANGALKDYVDTEIATLSDEIDAVSDKVGDTAVSSQISSAMATKADANHAHDDLYYTETEVDTKLAAKADAEHTHDLTDVSVNHATTADTANAVAWGNITGKPDNFAVADHEHEIADVAGLQDALDAKVPTTRTVNGKALSGDITLAAEDVGADVSGAASTAETNAKTYTDGRMTALVGDEAVSVQINKAVTSVEEQIIDPAFYVTFTRQDDNTYTADKAYDEVEAAYVAKQSVMGLLDFGDTMLYHIPVTYYESGKGVAFHVDLESYNPITIAYGPDGTIVAQTYEELASMTYVDDAVAAIVHPVTSVNSQTGAVTITASNIGAETAGAADAALTSANSHTDTELARLVGDEPVADQINSAVAAAGLYAVTATSSDGVSYTATVPGITTLTAGVRFIMIPGRASNSTTPTLNVNGLGAKNIRRRLSNLATSVQSGYTATWLAASNAFTLTYDGTQWIVEGLTKPVSADLYGTLSIAKGGTGATTAEAARENLLIVVSSTEPTSPTTGTLWFQI